VAPRSRRRRLVIALLAVVLGTVVLAGCLPPPAGTPASITTDPPLFPAFQTGITNYVVRCNPGTPVAVHVTSPTSTLVSVNGGYPQGGIYGAYVNQQPGQRFTIAVTTDPAHDVTTRYNVRCLPTDFPQWNVQTAPYGLTPFFMTAPLTSSTPTYTGIYDRNGVPLWWSKPEATINSTLLPDGNVGTMTSEGVDERTLDGTFVRSVKTVGGRADGHDVLLLPNGHFVLVTIQARPGVDLTAVGGPANASVCDHVVQEIDPADGSVVWSWDTYDHIPVTEMDPQWWPGAIAAGPTISYCGYDVYHWNAIEPTGTGFILSYRHLDAVYEIDQASGNILWKLGGTPRPERLTMVGDPVFTGGSHFGGQHDSRLLPDGTVTFFDDGSGLPRLGRAVRYSINTTAHTATLLDSVSDPGVSASYCCGSARYLGSGVWVIGWGGSADGVGKGTESVNGIRQYSLSFPGGSGIIYRMIPLKSSQVTTQQLVDAMDTRFAKLSAADEPPLPGGVTPFPP
jgi:Arylsulfotransferase (ASST)